MNKKVVVVFLIAMILTASLILGGINIARNGGFKALFSKNEPDSSVAVIETNETVSTEPSDANNEVTILSSADALNYVSNYATENGIDISLYPQAIYSFMANNPSSVDFFLNYPANAEAHPIREVISDDSESDDQDDTLEEPEPLYSLDGEISTARITTLYQWDERWGMNRYANSRMCFTGSAPTCVSMVAMYLLHNPAFTPAWIAEYSMNNGYCSSDCDGGSEAALISDGGFNLGIDVTEITIDEDRIKRNLDCPNPIICDVGDHFIILISYDEENFTVIDPTSEVDTNREWTWTELQMRLERLWVYRIM